MNAYEYFLTLKKQLELTEEEEMALNQREATIKDLFYMQGLTKQENTLYSLLCRRYTTDNIKRIMKLKDLAYSVLLSKIIKKLFPYEQRMDSNEIFIKKYIEEKIYGEQIG